MGVYIEAIIKHELSVEQIVSLPALLRLPPYDEFQGEWSWYYPATDANFIKWLWSLSLEEYLKQPAPATLATFISNEQFLISFNNEDTISFSGLKDVLFENNLSVRTEFQRRAENLCELIKGKDLFYVSDILVDAYLAAKSLSDLDSFDQFKAYLKEHNYHFYRDIQLRIT